MEICHICKQEFIRIGDLTCHYKKKHNYTHTEARKQVLFYNKGLDFPKCPFCGKDVFYCRNNIIRQTCDNPACRRLNNIKRQKKWWEDHPEEREKRSYQRTNYLQNKNNFHKTAWGIKSSNKLSYLEQWFVDNIIIPYKLNEKYDIINERTVSRYFLDFSFENIKLDVELDGKCHFINGEKRIEHDYNRDKYLESLGWKIYRISYLEIQNHPDETINNFILYLNNQKEYQINYQERINLSNKLYISNKEYKEKIKKDKKITQKIKQQKQIEKYNTWYNALKSSNINFNKIGWKTKSINLLNISKRQFYNFLNNTTFIKDLNCYINKNMKGSLGQKWIINSDNKRIRIKTSDSVH